MSKAARRPLVVGNWKMNLTEVWAERLAAELVPRIAPLGGVDVAVAPAFPCLAAVRRVLQGTSIHLAAQNVHWEDQGAFTGEVSARMLSEAGVSMVILGHSERRTLFGETDDRVRRKAATARRHRLVPILCVGEHEAQRDAGRTLSIIEAQLRAGLAEIGREDAAQVAVAYEPVWAIGTGRTASPEQVDEVHRMIREQLASMWGSHAALVRILCGGSVTPEAAPQLLALPEVDGALVGGASLDPGRFSAIVRAAA
jgi:triosephosphate isomerase